MGKTILIVDDALTIRKIVGFTLKAAGHQTIEAPDGAAAFDLVKDRPVDLVISDLNMPHMDGIELTKQLRATRCHSKTPILLLTAVSDEQSKAQGRQAGATGWMTKPFKQDLLMQVISKIFPPEQALIPA